MNKSEFRKLTNQILSKFSDDDIKKASDVINHSLLSVLVGECYPYKTILFFNPVRDEPQIQETITEILKDGPIALPRIEVDEIVPVEIKSWDDLEMVESWGPKWGPLPTPKQNCPIIDLSTIDVVIVPGRAFSKSGTRLGRGKGHYDKFLPKIPFSMKIGVAFHSQLFGELPTEPHDIPMNMIITDKTILEQNLWT